MTRKRLALLFLAWFTVGLVWPTVGGISGAVLLGIAGLGMFARGFRALSRWVTR